MALSTSSGPIRTPVPGVRRITTVSEQQRHARFYLVWWYVGALALAGLLGTVLVVLGPTPSAIAWLLFIAVIITILYNPRYGLYLIPAIVLMSDGLLNPWYPVTKNLSSIESLLYLSDVAIFNPLELFLVLLIGSWMVRMIATRKYAFVAGKLLVPALAFLGFTILGFVTGLSKGGDLTIALWSARPLFYLPLMLVLVSNLIRTRDHVRHLIWSAMIGLAVNGFQGFLFVTTELQWNLKSVLEIAEHSYSIHLNTMFVLLMMLFYFKTRPRMKWFLLLNAPFMLVALIGNQRRAGYVALAVALLVFGLLLQWYNRKAFWMVVPPLMVVFVLYVGAFWNSTSGAAVVAQQVRSIVAPVKESEEESSNLYRQLENVNLLYTIHQEPLTGVGFGQKFYIIAPMPDISFFVWWEYITHNSIVWIWAETGLGGFLAMAFLVGSAVSLGMRRMFETPPGDMRAISFLAVSYVIMHFVYAYVDMSWDGESMIYLGMMMGLINGMEFTLARPGPVARRRWPWQREPEPEPALQMT